MSTIPRKKSDEIARSKAKFGRTSTHNLTMGIVGLPNVGKSSLFNIMTEQQVPAQNYAFCTIDPSEAKVAIKDPRMDQLMAIYKSKKRVPAYLTVFDIAGLVKGASEGLGLGNRFLENIRQVDGIYHVVRCFEDDSIVHVDDSVDPVRDCTVIGHELRLKDLADCQSHLESAKKQLKAKSNDKQVKLLVSSLEKLMSGLEAGQDARAIDFTSEEIRALKPLNLITAKNVVYLANISSEMFLRKKVPSLAGKLARHLAVADPGAPLVLVSAGLADAEETNGYLTKTIAAGYASLELSNFFTCGPEEVHSWTIREGTLAPDAGAVIHSDFKQGFVAVDVISYADIIEHGCEQKVKSLGLCKMKGKDYAVANGDILHFKAGRINPAKK
ncbi:obg-like ATPase 1 [Nematocida homosporus]|uniref:obg-like ATPase 1 n=1 Tax=Nematocida homosporus TaxID=1912981 RepID=UPI00221FCF91|nr:obg-like ATPase 1 [Nematocida homosporus]KAI5186391.1 obg-like ATPase 1 [Nematocida homosporus]